MEKEKLYIKKHPEGPYLPIDFDKGLVVGHITVDKEKEPRLYILPVNNPTFSEAIDDVMSTVNHLCKIAVQNNAPKDDVYKVVVQAFSIVIDEFYPEAKDKFKFMTEKEKELLTHVSNKQV